MSNIYLVTEDKLLDLLESKHRLNCLEYDGVDNWTWCMMGSAEYLSRVLNLPIDQIREYDYDFADAANISLKNFQKYV